MEGKIAILGAGHVGSHVARALAACEAAEEIVLIDKLQEKASAQAMDIADSLSFSSGKIRVRAGSYGDCADADITVSAIGKPREPGQTRLDLLGDSVRMAHELAGQLGEKGVGGLLVSITNPCDIIAGCLRRLLGMDRFRAFGTGTLLDTARLIRILSEQTGVPCCGIEALVLGEHGDSSMIPYSALRIDGVPAAEVPGFNPFDRNGYHQRKRLHGVRHRAGRRLPLQNDPVGQKTHASPFRFPGRGIRAERLQLRRSLHGRQKRN